MDRRLTTVVFLMVGCALALSLAAHFFVVFPFDLKITHELQEVNTPVFAAVMQSVSLIGDTWVGIVIIIAVSALYAFRGQWLEACFILMTVSSIALASVIKVVVARPRPPDFIVNPADFFHSIDQYSFPSGHVLFFIVFFGFIAYLAWLYLAGRSRILVIAVCSILVLLIGPSRVYLGAHWASDVLGSYVIGALLLLFIILGYHLALRIRNTRLVTSPG
jgi:membrane-associated phospholipid phosphatase